MRYFLRGALALMPWLSLALVACSEPVRLARHDDVMARMAADRAEADRRSRAQAERDAAEVRAQEHHPVVTPEPPCDEACELKSLVDDACWLTAEIENARAGAAQEWRDAREFGVVDLAAVQDYKDVATSLRLRLERDKEQIKTRRGGKKFSSKDCLGLVPTLLVCQ